MMDVQKGTQFIGFISVILGSATFGVCTWIYFTYHLGFDHNHIHPAVIEGCVNLTMKIHQNDFLRKDLQENPIQSEDVFIGRMDTVSPMMDRHTWECVVYLHQFTKRLISNAGAIFITSIVHCLSAAYLMAGTPMESRSRAKSWIVLQLGFIVIYFMCFMSSTSFPSPSILGEEDAPLVLSTVKYFAGYCLILTFDIVIGFVLLVAAMIVVKHGQDVGYSLMNV